MDSTHTIKAVIHKVQSDTFELGEARSLSSAFDKLLEGRLQEVKNLEAEVYRRCLKTLDSKSKLINKAIQRVKQLEHAKQPEDMQTVKYMLNKLLSFDSKQEQFEVEAFDPTMLDSSFKMNSDSMAGAVILRDLKDIHVKYIFTVHKKTYEIEQMMVKRENKELERCQTKEVEVLVNKLKSFVDGKPYSCKRMIIAMIEKHLQTREEYNTDNSILN